jgi:hypothetical protein
MESLKIVYMKKAGSPTLEKLAPRRAAQPLTKRNEAMVTIPETAPAGNLIARYATFHNEPGYALRLANRMVVFVTHDAEMTTLTNADIPALTLLGDVNTAERQHLLDTLAGGAAAICTSRQMEVP